MASKPMVSLQESDLALIELVRAAIVQKNFSVRDWRSADPADIQRFQKFVSAELVNTVHGRDLALTASRITNAIMGIGLLQPFLGDDGVDEIYVRGQEIAIERGGKLQRHVGAAPESYWHSLIERVAEMSGRAIDTAYPAVLVDLPGGARFTGMLPPLMDSPAINIRVFRRSALDLAALRKLGSFDRRNDAGLTGTPADIFDGHLAARVQSLPDGSIDKFLAYCMATLSANMLILGEFSSGKTVMLNALSAYLPGDAPVAVLETVRELRLDERLFQMRAIAPSEKIDDGPARADMQWVLNTIYTRANPAAVILGEIVSPGEAMQFIKAANLGRRAYATIHGGTEQQALGRLETLALGAQSSLGLAAVRRMAADGLNLLVRMGRKAHRNGVHRFVSRVSRVVGVDAAGDYILETLYDSGAESARDLYLPAVAQIAKGEHV